MGVFAFIINSNKSEMTNKIGLLYVGFVSISYGILVTVVKYANELGAGT